MSNLSEQTGTSGLSGLFGTSSTSGTRGTSGTSAFGVIKLHVLCGNEYSFNMFKAFSKYDSKLYELFYVNHEDMIHDYYDFLILDDFNEHPRLKEIIYKLSRKLLHSGSKI